MHVRVRFLAITLSSVLPVGCIHWDIYERDFIFGAFFRAEERIRQLLQLVLKNPTLLTVLYIEDVINVAAVKVGLDLHLLHRTSLPRNAHSFVQIQL